MMLLHRTKLAGKSNAGTTCHFTDLTLNSVYVLVSFLLWSLASFLIRWFVFTFLLSVARSLVRSFVTEVTRSFVCLFACQLIRLFARLSFAHSVTRTLLVCSFGGSHFVRSFVRSLVRFLGMRVILLPLSVNSDLIHWLSSNMTPRYINGKKGENWNSLAKLTVLHVATLVGFRVPGTVHTRFGP